jgi:tetratricopeptide (TPR) repeat protein
VPDELDLHDVEGTEQAAEQAAFLERDGRWEEAAELYALVHRKLLTSGRTEQAFTALWKQARTLFRQGQFSRAEVLTRSSYELAEQHGYTRLAGRSLNLLGAIRHSEQDLASAREFYARAQDLAISCGDDHTVGVINQNLGIIANIQGDFHEARALYLASIGSAIRGEDSAGAMTTYLNLGKACVCLEDWLEAEVYFERGIEIAEQLDESPTRTRLHANLAVPLIYTGEFPRARAALDTAAQLANRIEDTDTLSHIARLRGRIARLEGKFGDAREYVIKSLRLATGPGFELARGEALEEHGRLCQAEGHLDEARVALEEARTCFLALDAQHEAARMEELLSQCDTVAAAAPASGATV